MEIPGVDSIIFKRAKMVWPGERPPSDELASLIDEVPLKIKVEHLQDATQMLESMASFDLEPSQTMRLRYLRGQLHSESGAYALAYTQYYEALRIAEDYDDLDSQIALTNLAGLMMFGQTQNQEALAYYQDALALWHRRAIQLPKPRFEPEILFRERIGSVLWALGDFWGARATLARALTLGKYNRSVRRTDFVNRRIANALWALGLSLRSQSDMADGSVSYLRIAIKRMKEAASIFPYVLDETENTIIGRLNIQIAELYLDLAEISLFEGNDETAAQRRRAARGHLNTAADYLDPAGDPFGVLLLRLSRLRALITTRADQHAVRTSPIIKAQLASIADQAEARQDEFTLAKVDLLRGEWLLWIGSVDQARETLLEAIAKLQTNGMGMATRAQRLLRRTNMPAEFLRMQRRRSSGPIAPRASDDEPKRDS